MRIIILSLLFYFPLFTFGEVPTIKLLSELELPGGDWYNSHDIVVHDEKAYLAYWEQSHNYGGILIFDISDHASPAIAGDYTSDVSAAYNGWEIPLYFQMELDYPHLYMPVRYGFDVIDVSNPQNPVRSGQYRIQEQSSGAIQAHDSTAMYVYWNTMDIVKRNDDEAYELQASLSLEIPELRGESASDLIWDGGEYAYVLMQEFRSRAGATHVVVVDVRDINNPQISQMHTIPVIDDAIARVGGWAIGYVQLDSLSFMNALSSRGSFWVQITDRKNPQSIYDSPKNWFRFHSYIIGSANSKGISIVYHPSSHSVPKLIYNLFPPRDNDDSVYLLSGEGNMIVTVETVNRIVRGAPRQYLDVMKVYRVQQTANVNGFEQYK